MHYPTEVTAAALSAIGIPAEMLTINALDALLYLLIAPCAMQPHALYATTDGPLINPPKSASTAASSKPAVHTATGQLHLTIAQLVCTITISTNQGYVTDATIITGPAAAAPIALSAYGAIGGTDSTHQTSATIAIAISIIAGYA